MPYPGHNGLFVRVIMYQSHISLFYVLHTNFALSVSLLCFLLCQYSYALTHTNVSNCRSISILDPIDNSSAIASYNFENPINQVEDKGEEDCEVPGELARLLQQEERAIQPHKGPVETVNLGTEEDRKEVKLGVNLELSINQRLI